MTQRVDHLDKKGMRILGLPINSDNCSMCVEGKAARPIFYERKKQSQKIGDLIHFNTSGSVTPCTLDRHRYFQVVTDDYTYFTVMYLLKQKNEAEENFKN